MSVLAQNQLAINAVHIVRENVKENFALMNAKKDTDLLPTVVKNVDVQEKLTKIDTYYGYPVVKWLDGDWHDAKEIVDLFGDIGWCFMSSGNTVTYGAWTEDNLMVAVGDYIWIDEHGVLYAQGELV